jgi:GNAT superfamily N-acetyltransferase
MFVGESVLPLFIMVTHFLSTDEVRAYLRDFLLRLERLEPIPTVWCPVTVSGTTLLKEMLPLMQVDHPDLAKKISVVAVSVNKEDKSIKFETKNPESDITNKNVLLFDSSMHTGGTMRRSVTEALRLGAANVATYSLVMKRGSCFIPTFWGVMIDDTDRVYFLLKKIPNGRLDAGPEKDKDGNPRKSSYVHIQRLCEDHLKAKHINCGVISLDRVTWGDRHFDMQAGEHKECTYVLQTGGNIVGYMSIHFSDPNCLFVTEIAVDETCKKKGYGAILMRFADTLARQSDCLWVRLNAIEQKIGWYEGFDYRQIPGRPPIVLDDEKYFPMEHKVVYLPVRLAQ